MQRFLFLSLSGGSINSYFNASNFFCSQKFHNTFYSIVSSWTSSFSKSYVSKHLIFIIGKDKNIFREEFSKIVWQRVPLIFPMVHKCFRKEEKYFFWWGWAILLHFLFKEFLCSWKGGKFHFLQKFRHHPAGIVSGCVGILCRGFQKTMSFICTIIIAVMVYRLYFFREH